MKKRSDVQDLLEKWWPLPGKSNFNVSIRDLIFGSLLAWLFLQTRLLFFIPVFFEPALLAFPLNTIAALVLRTPRFWDPLVLEPKLQLLLDKFPEIRAEAIQVKQLPKFSNFSGQGRIAEGENWSVFPFFSNGEINEANCLSCPILSSIILQIPSIRLAMLSVMDECYIKPHCGYTKSVLRVHLTLLAEGDGERYITVGGENYSWKEGELVAFDDTYLHSVTNKVKGKRVVLFLDVDRPYSTSIGTLFGKLMRFLFEHSHVVKSLAKLQETKEK